MLVTGGSCIPLLGVRNQYRAGGGGVPDLPLSAVSFLFLASGCTGVRLFSRFRDSSLSFLIASHIRVVSWNLTAPPIAFPSSSLGFVLIPTPLIQLLPHLVFATSPPRTHFPPLPKPNSGFSLSGFFTCHMLYRVCVCEVVRM